MSRRAVITGIGVVAPNGVGTETYWSATRNGKNAVRRITSFDPSPYPTQLAGEVQGFKPEDHIDGRLIVQTDRWTWLVTLAYTQLRLARRTIEDVHLPWEQPQRPNRRVLTAARVRQAFPQLLVTLETPANAPKPCGRSPGRPKGARSGRAPRRQARQALP